jgi:oxygen-independent coproporphyrinogen-3 oxidase
MTAAMTGAPLFDADLIRRYDVNGPRYTSYPTALQFREDFDAAAYHNLARESNGDPIPAPLSLYVHIPFCATVCFYCACTKIVTRNRRHGEDYLALLFREMEMQARLFDADRIVEQVHWGGGSPTFLDDGQMRDLMEHTRRLFRLAGDGHGEFSIEIDPRTLRPGTVDALRAIGFNRASLGVQDLDPTVQQAVNRIQPEELTVTAVAELRRAGFRSVSMDLIYGLPRQTPESFARTLERVIAIRPDRLSVFNYAHLPQRFKSQRRIDATTLPAPASKLEILGLTVAALTRAGYEYIGMDHFALPGDALCAARRRGTLHRNFQGYSTHGHCDLVGLGMSSIGHVSDCYAQNARTLAGYRAAVEGGRLPVERGLALSPDDRLRRRVIMTLLCYFALRPSAIERDWDIDFWEYFAHERLRLQAFVADGLLRVEDDLIEVLPRGRLLARNICMVFDRHLGEGADGRYSRAL